MILDNGLIAFLFFPVLAGLLCAGVTFMFAGFSRIVGEWFS